MRTSLLLLLLALSANLHSQIAGIVTDESKQPVPGVNIYIKNTYEGTTSDADGKFTLKTSLRGKHLIVASFIGYQTYEQEITISNDTLKLDIILQENTSELQTIEITAGSFAAGDKYKSVALKPFDIATTASAEGDIYGAVSTLPGAQKVGEQGMLFVRGGEAYETKTYMDGMLVQRPYFSNLPELPTRGRFSPLLFNGTVFSSGGYSAEFGQALSSVLLLNTNALAEKTKSDIMLFSVGGSGSHTHRWDKTSISVNLEYQNLKPYVSLIKQDIDWIKAPENVGSTIVYRRKIGSNGMLKTFAAFSNNKSSLFIPSMDFVNDDSIALSTSDYYINTTYSDMLNEKWMLKTGVAYNHNIEKINFNGDEIQTYSDAFQYRLAFENDIAKRVKLKFGGEVSTEEFTEKIYLVDSIDNYQIKFRNVKYGAFAETEFQLSKTFAARAGGRLEFNELEQTSYINPRLSFAYQLNEYSSFSAAYGSFTQTAEPDYLKINNKLRSEEASHYILNYQFTKNKRVFRAELYYKDYNRLVKYTDYYSYNHELFNNNGYGYAKGLDLFLRDNKTIKNADYWISYSYADAKRDYHDYPEQAVPYYASAHNFSIVYKQFLKMGAFYGLTYSYSSGRPYYNPNSTQFHNDRTKAYQNLSGNFTYIIDFFGNMSMIHLTVNNILGFNNVFSYRYADTPNETGAYDRIPVKQAPKRFFVLGFIIMIE